MKYRDVFTKSLEIHKLLSNIYLIFVEVLVNFNSFIENITIHHDICDSYF